MAATPESRQRGRMSSPFPLAPVTPLQQSEALRRLSFGSHVRRDHVRQDWSRNLNTSTHGAPSSPSCNVKKLARSLTCVATPEKTPAIQRTSSVDLSRSLHKRLSIQRHDSNTNPTSQANRNQEKSNSKTGDDISVCGRFFRLIFRVLRAIVYLIFYVVVFAIAVIGVVIIFGKYRNLEHGACVYSQHINVSEIHARLQKKVFGQHVAVNVITDSLQQFMKTASPRSPLVLSFHGWTGVGKNHVSEILSQTFPARDVHEIVIPLHYPHSDEAESYGHALNSSIMDKIRPCTKQIFILDEVDGASWDIAPAIRNVLQQLHDTEVSQSSIVVVLLSSTGSTALNSHMLEWLSQGNKRSVMSHKYLRDVLLSQHAWHVDLYKAGLITEIVPFLPLEREHVRQCVIQDLTNKGKEIQDGLIEEVLDEVVYFPKNAPLFSTSGCRKVTSYVDIKLK